MAVGKSTVGKLLAERASNLFRFLEFQGYGHNDLVMGKGDEIVASFKALIEALPN